MIEARAKKILSQLFSIECETINETTSPDNVKKWDSLGHMNLILALEEEFGIHFDETQIVEMLNFPLILISINEHLKDCC